MTETTQRSWMVWLLVLAVAVVTMPFFWPLLTWLGQVSLRGDQLNLGGLLVVSILLICLSDSLKTLHLMPRYNRKGGVLMAWGLVCLSMSSLIRERNLPLELLAFSLCAAAVLAFLFGRCAVRELSPAMAGLFVLGLMACVRLACDWPLRLLAGHGASQLLMMLQQPVQLAVKTGQSSELLLHVGRSSFIVANECNGFGLLTSALIMAIASGYRLRFRWLNKLGLAVLAVLVAIICNWLRIVVIVLLEARVSMPYKLVHDAVGLLFCAAGLMAIWFAAERETTPCSSSGMHGAGTGWPRR